MTGRKRRKICICILVACILVSYFGVNGLYNANVKNYAARSAAVLSENKSIGSGSQDILRNDNTAAVTPEIKNVGMTNTDRLAESWLLAVILTAAAGAIRVTRMYDETSHLSGEDGGGTVVAYIHSADGKKRPGYAGDGCLGRETTIEYFT